MNIFLPYNFIFRVIPNLIVKIRFDFIDEFFKWSNITIRYYVHTICWIVHLHFYHKIKLLVLYKILNILLIHFNITD